MAPKTSSKRSAATNGRRTPARRRLSFCPSGEDVAEDVGALHFTLYLTDGGEADLRGDRIEVTSGGDLLVWGKVIQPDEPPTPIVIMIVAAGEWRACTAMLSLLAGGGAAAVIDFKEPLS